MFVSCTDHTTSLSEGIIFSSLFLFSCSASALTIDFENTGLSHGTIINNQFSSSGVTVGAINLGGGPDLAVIFDSTLNGTRDPDLESPWSGGNISQINLGNMLIIHKRIVLV